MINRVKHAAPPRTTHLCAACPVHSARQTPTDPPARPAAAPRVLFGTLFAFCVPACLHTAHTAHLSFIQSRAGEITNLLILRIVNPGGVTLSRCSTTQVYSIRSWGENNRRVRRQPMILSLTVTQRARRPARAAGARTHACTSIRATATAVCLTCSRVASLLTNSSLAPPHTSLSYPRQLDKSTSLHGSPAPPPTPERPASHRTRARDPQCVVVQSAAHLI